MPDNPTPREKLTRGDRNFGDMERDVVYLLTEPCQLPTLWSVADIGREMQYFDPEALILPLQCAGLVYKTSDDFVFATPAAFRMASLVEHAA
jgi:hypothetical protein